MKIYQKLLSVVLTLLMIYSCSPKEMATPNIIPQPQHITKESGRYILSKGSPIIILDDNLAPLAELFQSYVKRASGIELTISKEDKGESGIFFRIDSTLEREAYTLNVAENITLEAADYKGLALGLSTLLQTIDISTAEVAIPNISISDSSEYNFRSVMLDLARFWHPIETIKETIDLLWLYKIEYLHIHLSDNRRFTFPLDDFPALKTIAKDGSREYYTREELDDLVEYAKQRGVVIIPEVELPGHSGQLFTKYPEVFGSVDSKTGEAKYIHVINIAKEEAYRASEQIINELAEVFYTSPYIHIGCDEVYLEALKEVPEYNTFCKKHNLEVALGGDANELFCYFINRLNEMVKATGKSSIIWEGFHSTGAGSQTISKDIPVVVWNTSYNHPDSLIQNGYEVINSTWIPWYMVGAMNLAAPQEESYKWDLNKWAHWNEEFPNVELKSKDKIRGGQISFWEQNHYKVIPVLRERAPVLAERLWNNDAGVSYSNFKGRFGAVDSLYERLFHPVKVSVSNLINSEDLRFKTTATITLNSEITGTIKYSISDSWKLPNMKSANNYREPIVIDKSVVLTVQLFDSKGETIGYPVQTYYEKIEPAFSYRVFGGAPQYGWSEMPDLSKLPVIREGFTGFMNPERLDKINGELFAKVKTEGHIDIRFNGMYNPYAVELKGDINIDSEGEYKFSIQTHDGLAELYIDGEPIGLGREFANSPEEFSAELSKGAHSVTIKYFYQKIQNQLSILYKSGEMKSFEPFENLVQPIK